MALCLTAGAVSAVIAVQAFTLAWTHSIEKVRWEEDWQIDWQIDWKIKSAQLRLVAARIRGTGAGMEPPPDAVLRDGVWHYRPTLPPIPRLILPDSTYSAAYELCVDGECRALRDYLPADGEVQVVSLESCSN